MDNTASVHLVDDDAAFLASMARLLRAAGFAVVTHPTSDELLTRVSGDTRGCLIADLNMPGVSGLELQAQLSARGVHLPVIFLTGQADIPSTVQAMRGGALDFLEKLAPKERLFAAINRALEREAAQHAARAQLAERRRRFAALTERERQVLVLVLSGKMNKQIAAALDIHERTVKLHRSAITAKLGVHSVAQLALMANEAQFPGTERVESRQS